MNDMQLGVVESCFADIIWENEPVSSAELVRICEAELNWKKSTTFTVLRRLCQKGIFENTGGSVKSLVSRDEFYSMRSEKFVDETFGGSLPAFLTAFTMRKKLTEQEVNALKKMVEEYEGE